VPACVLALGLVGTSRTSSRSPPTAGGRNLPHLAHRCHGNERSDVERRIRLGLDGWIPVRGEPPGAGLSEYASASERRGTDRTASRLCGSIAVVFERPTYLGPARRANSSASGENPNVRDALWIHYFNCGRSSGRRSSNMRPVGTSSVYWKLVTGNRPSAHVPNPTANPPLFTATCRKSAVPW